MSAGQKERLDPRLMAALCLAATAGVVNNAALGPFIPDIASDFDSSVPVVGQVAAAAWLMSAFAGIFAGPLADHYGHRRLLALGLLLTMTSALGGALAPGYWWLVLARVVGGLGFSATVGVAFAIVTMRYSGEARLRAVSIITSSLSVAAILGIPVLTSIAGLLSWRGAWVFVALLAATSTLLLVTNVPATASGNDGRFRVRQLIVAYAPLVRARHMVLLFSGVACQGMLFVAALTYIGAYFIDELGLSVQQFGLVSAISVSAFFFGSVTAGRLGRLDLRSTFAWTTLVTGALLLVAFAMPGGVVVTTALISVAFFFAGIQVVNIMTLVANETPTGQGTTMVINESIFALGAAAGAASGGLLIEIGGFRALGLGMPIIAVLAAVSVWRPGPAMLSEPVIEPDVSVATAGEDVL
ncbi:N/A [soil metagenome]